MVVAPGVSDGLEGTKAPPDRVGRGLRQRVLVAVLAGPRPEQGEAFAILVVEQVRIDRCVERGIVELEREVVAALFRALRPGRPDLRLMRCTA